MHLKMLGKPRASLGASIGQAGASTPLFVASAFFKAKDE